MKTAKPRNPVRRKPLAAGHDLKIQAVSESSKLIIYLHYPNGSRRFIMSHRWNPSLWALLKVEGANIDDLRRLKPKRSRSHHSLYDSVQYLLKIIESYFEYEIAA